MSRPVQCSDDVGGSDSSAYPSYQTGQEVSVSDMLAAAQRRDLATDAQADPTPPRRAAAPMAAGDGGARQASDTVVIKGQYGTIEAKGLAENLRPGAVLQIGHTNHMVMHQYKDGTKYTATGPAHTPNRIPITPSQEPPKDIHLRAVSQEIAGDWRLLGRQLQLSDAALDQIRMDFSVNGQLEVNHQVLRKWMETTYPATLHILATALAKIGRGDLADKLSEMSGGSPA